MDSLVFRSKTTALRWRSKILYVTLRPTSASFSRRADRYRTQIEAGDAALLSVGAVQDFGWVYLNSEKVGVFDRRGGRFRLAIPARERSCTLDILVEAMGRVNFGREVVDRKGLHAPVTLGDSELHSWQIFSLPLEAAQLETLQFSRKSTPKPAFWRGQFRLERVGDTFFDLRSWGKGVVWVNGHCLGRFWNIGPTQTMFCPNVWLREGENQVVVLDFLSPGAPLLAGLKTPILGELRPELDFSRPQRARGTLELSASVIVAQGRFHANPEWHDVAFPVPVKGRYLCLEALNAHDDGPFAAIAELEVRGQNGQILPKSGWKVVWVSSEEVADDDGLAENVFNGQAASIWHTAWSREPTPSHPHSLVLDLGASHTLTALRYLPRAGDRTTTGRLKDFRVFFSPSPFGLKLVANEP